MEEKHMYKYKEFLETINFEGRELKNIRLVGLLINNVYTILGGMGGNIKVNPQIPMFIENVLYLIDALKTENETDYASALQTIFNDSDIINFLAKKK